MESEILLKNPEYIIYALIAIGIVLLFWRKKKKFKKGVIIANTKYVKRTGYFRMLNAKYHIYNIIIKVACILLILISATLTSRLYEIKKHQETHTNRDIMLCMDFSPSMVTLNYDILKTMMKTVSSFSEERFGFTIFDSSANTLIPLNTDYNYVIDTMDNLSNEFYGTKLTQEGFLEKESTYGIHLVDGFSRVSDGIVSCAANFTEDNERTKIMILSTDNLGKGLFVSMDDAITYCKMFNIKVYPVGAISIESSNDKNIAEAKAELNKLAEETGGKYFDYSEYKMDAIAKEIDRLNKSSIITESYVTETDLPEVLFKYLLIIIAILFVLDWRVRI